MTTKQYGLRTTEPVSTPRPAFMARCFGRLERWVERPLSGQWLALGWFASTAVFIGMIRFVGGPSEGDASESVYSTWAIAHGRLSCAYSPQTAFHFAPIARPSPFIAPLWPIISGALSALVRVGHGVPFPSQAKFGPHCSTALSSMYEWAIKSNAIGPSVRLGYLSWIVLMAGIVALLRASGRGRRVWEPLSLVLLACIPSIWLPVVQFFHPQDVVAMGLCLGGIACVRRDRWIWAGLLLGLAVTSQQFALLVLAPLVVIVPADRRLKFVGAAASAAALIVLPLAVLTSGRVMPPVLLGSGDYVSFGGTLLWELHLHGALLIIMSRVMPIVVSMAFGRWAVRRIGTGVLESVPLLSLIATSLGLRIVFEQNLFGYYFMALALSNVLLDIVRARIRGQVLVWLALVSLAFSPVPWGFFSNSVAWGLQEREFVPFVFIAIVSILVVRDVIRDNIRWYLVASLAIALGAFARVPWDGPPFRHAMPIWFWQIVLVTSGVVLAVSPLLSEVRARTTTIDRGCEGELSKELLSTGV